MTVHFDKKGIDCARCEMSMFFLGVSWIIWLNIVQGALKGVSSYNHNGLSKFWVPKQTCHQVAALPVPLKDMIPPNNRLKWPKKTIFLKILAICMVFSGCKKMEKAVK